MTANADLAHASTSNNQINSSNLNNTDSKVEDSNKSSTLSNNQNNEDVFQIAAKAQKLLQEILTANKLNGNKAAETKDNAKPVIIKQEPIFHASPPLSENSSAPPVQQINGQFHANLNNGLIQTNQLGNQHYPHPPQYFQPQQQIFNNIPTHNNFLPNFPQQAKYFLPPSGPGPGPGIGLVNPNFYMQCPPPLAPLSAPTITSSATIAQQPFYYQTIQHNQSQQSNQIQSNYYQTLNSYHNIPLDQHLMHAVIPQMQNHYFTQSNPFNNTTGPTVAANLAASSLALNNNNSNNNLYFRKRNFGEINNSFNNSRFKAPSYNSYQSKSTPLNKNVSSLSAFPKSSTANSNVEKLTSSEAFSELLISNCQRNDSANNIELALNEEEEDLNIMRERELKELKCKSVVEKMSVFLKYYQQFKDTYIIRVQSIECNDSLKLQFHSLIKYLNEYGNLLSELYSMITEHERNSCKNNHRKLKKFFNKAKAFIRYECNKRLNSNIFEYRRLINSQDRYAGMYDLLDMNSYLISLLPDIGISIRRFINRCEKAKEQERLEEEDYQNSWYNNEDNSTDSTTNTNVTEYKSLSFTDVNDFKIPTFKEFVALNPGTDQEEDDIDDENGDNDDEEFNYQEEDEEDDEDSNQDEAPKNKKIKIISDEVSVGDSFNSKNNDSNSIGKKSSIRRTYESFSIGIDSLNRYLLKRVEDEESLDELVKERIIKWINKRQAKYILIFSEVDKLLNQHTAGECYPKFHSYLLFNLGKLVTVCDSYHQKLKELLYSTTIRRKKKRKKVKLLPESMIDVFNEINELKRSLESKKINIKRCNLNTGKELNASFDA